MTSSETNPTTDDIARIAYAIWQAEGQPEGCDQEHWMRAKQLILEGRAEAEYPRPSLRAAHMMFLLDRYSLDSRTRPPGAMHDFG